MTSRRIPVTYLCAIPRDDDETVLLRVSGHVVTRASADFRDYDSVAFESITYVDDDSEPLAREFTWAQLSQSEDTALEHEVLRQWRAECEEEVA